MKKANLLLLALVTATSAQAQDIQTILNSIEQNNKQLQAIKNEADAAMTEIKSRNNLENLAIEFSPFFAKGESGVASSELIVKQGFDFPTLYAARNKSGNHFREAMDMQYMAARRDILLQAKTLCINIIYSNQVQTILDKRHKNAEEMLAFAQKQLENGDATALEVNKVKMELMNIRKEVAELEAARQADLQSLTAMNGNAPVTLTADTYAQDRPTDDYAAMFDKAMSANFDIKATQASEQAMAQEVKISKQNWIPKFEVGYRRNAEGDEAVNGILIGASIPLYSSRNKVSIAKTQHAGAQLQAENARIEAENETRAKISELQSLDKARDAYDVALMQETIDLLKKAVENGQISIMEYYGEADMIYQNMHTYLDLNKQYQTVMAEIYKNNL